MLSRILRVAEDTSVEQMRLAQGGRRGQAAGGTGASRRLPGRRPRRCRARRAHRGVGGAGRAPRNASAPGGLSRRRGSRAQPRGGRSPAGSRETGSQHRGGRPPAAPPAARIRSRAGGIGNGHRPAHSAPRAVRGRRSFAGTGQGRPGETVGAGNLPHPRASGVGTGHPRAVWNGKAKAAYR